MQWIDLSDKYFDRWVLAENFFGREERRYIVVHLWLELVVHDVGLEAYQ
jgi:hypothetical protein